MSLVALLSVACLAISARAQVPDAGVAVERGWISVSGTVVSTAASSFRLDYGRGVVTVSVGDWRWLGQDSQLIADHKVTVFGDVDKAEGGKPTLRAAGLYEDGEGFQQLEVGDRIRVIGRLDSAYFASSRVIAKQIVSIEQLEPSAT